MWLSSTSYLPYRYPFHLSFSFKFSDTINYTETQSMMTPGCLSLTNPNPNFLGLPLKNIRSSPLMASVSFSPFSLRPETIHRQQRTLLFTNMASLSLKRLGGITSQWRNSKKMNLSTVTFAASHEESVSSDSLSFIYIFM